jgi:lambda family phage portal protein
MNDVFSWHGVPWLCSPMTRLHHLEAYELAELTASRSNAEKGGYFETAAGVQFTGEQESDENRQNKLNDFEPMSFDELPPGVKFVPYDPKHPVDAYPDFISGALMGISAGAGMTYATLTGDVSKTNFSSLRMGKDQERLWFRDLQAHFIRHFCEPIFTEWLIVQLTLQNIRLPFSKFDKFNAPSFRGRRWKYHEPQTDVTAALAAINGGLNSRTRAVQDSDGDFEEILNELSEEKILIDQAGLTFTQPGVGGAPGQQPQTKVDAKPSTE